MNIIDLIHRNLFLKKIFPDGLSTDVYIGPFELREAGGFSMSIHTRQKPAIPIAKWGEHGSNYDVITIQLSGNGATRVNIDNWENAKFALFIFTQEDESIHITANEADWTFDIVVETLIFQGCSTYIE